MCLQEKRISKSPVNLTLALSPRPKDELPGAFFFSGS